MIQTLNCDQCGRETADDQSEVWVLVTNGDSSRICHECAPPDDEDTEI